MGEEEQSTGQAWLDRLTQVTTEIAGDAGALALTSLVGPAGIVAAPLIRDSLRAFMASADPPAVLRAGWVIAQAGTAAGFENPEDFARVVTDSAGLHDVVVRGMSAAAATASPWKLRLLARALANAASDDANLELDALIVRTAEDVDSAHVQVLARFSWSRRQLGLSDSDEPMESFNDTQIEMAMGDQFGAGLRAMLAGLVRHGLVLQRSSSGGSLGGGGSGTMNWSITEYGRAFLEVLREAGTDPGIFDHEDQMSRP